MLPCAAMLNGEYGVKGLYIGVPVVIGAGRRRAHRRGRVQRRGKGDVRQVGRRGEVADRRHQQDRRPLAYRPSGTLPSMARARKGHQSVVANVAERSSVPALPRASCTHKVPLTHVSCYLQLKPEQQDFMNIHEYQAKALLAKFAVPLLKGGVAYTKDEAMDVARKLGSPVSVVKAQIHAGGRGKGRFKDDPNGKGGVRIAKSIDEVGAARRGHAGHDAGHQADRPGRQDRQAPLYRGRLRHQTRALSPHAGRPRASPRHRHRLDRRRHGHRGGGRRTTPRRSSSVRSTRPPASRPSRAARSPSRSGSRASRSARSSKLLGNSTRPSPSSTARWSRSTRWS